jgi:hypothetical protein
MATCGAGQIAFGVAKYDVASGSLGGVYGTPGRIVPVVAGGAVTAGQKVMSDAAGEAVTWTSAASEANNALGYALNTAADGELVEVKLF